jgi:hypothetical protein
VGRRRGARRPAAPAWHAASRVVAGTGAVSVGRPGGQAATGSLEPARSPRVMAALPRPNADLERGSSARGMRQHVLEKHDSDQSMEITQAEIQDLVDRGLASPVSSDSDSTEVIGTRSGRNDQEAASSTVRCSSNVLVLLLMSPLMLYYLALVVASFIAVTVIDSEGVGHAIVLRATANFQVLSVILVSDLYWEHATPRSAFAMSNPQPLRTFCG